MAAPVEAAEAEAVDLTGDDEGPPGLMTVDPIEDPDMQRAIGASLGMSGADGAGTSGGASGSSSRARRRTTAAAGAAMSGPFALLWCESARHVGKAPRPGETDPTDVRLADLVTPGCTKALILQFGSHLGSIFGSCPVLHGVEQLIICADREYLEPMEEELKVMRFNAEQLPPDLRLLGVQVASTPTGAGEYFKYGTHHTKAMLLEFEAGMRLIITSGPIVRAESSSVMEVVCCQDFPLLPKEERAAEADYRPTCEFGRVLVDFVSATLGGLLKLGEKEALLRWLSGHDFSCARFALVPSVPGEHEGPHVHDYGQLALRRLLERERFPPVFRGGPIINLSPSLNYMTPDFSQSMRESLSAGACTEGEPLGSGKLSILWRSVSDVRNCCRGWMGGPGLTGTAAALSCSGVRPHLSRFVGECGRGRTLLHGKVFVRTDPDCKQLAWVMVGSHNHSMAAFGTPQKGGEQLHIKSFELSCLLLPRLECAYRRSPQFGFTCTPAPGAPPPVPDQGMYGVRHVAFVPYTEEQCCSRVEQQLGGDRALVLPLPIPFSLKSEPFAEGDSDPYFCWGQDYGDLKDSFGRTFTEAMQGLVPAEEVELQMLQQGLLQSLGGGGAAERDPKRQRCQEEDVGLAMQISMLEQHAESQRRRSGGASGSGGGSGASAATAAAAAGPDEMSAEGQQLAWEQAQAARAAQHAQHAQQAQQAGDLAAALRASAEEEERRCEAATRQAMELSRWQAAAAASMQPPPQQEGPIDLTDSQHASQDEDMVETDVIE